MISWVFVHEIIENHREYVFLLIVRPLAGDFCGRRGWGWRWGVSIWDHFESILDNNNRTLLCKRKKGMFCQPNIYFLEMAHTNFVSSIRIRPDQPLIWIENKSKHVFELSKTHSLFSKEKSCFKICSYIHKITLNLIKHWQ